MNEILSFWAQWLRPSAGLPTVQWSLLLAVAAMTGYLLQRHIGLPKVVGVAWPENVESQRVLRKIGMREQQSATHYGRTMHVFSAERPSQ
mgnify:CR=1 FL=1